MNVNVTAAIVGHHETEALLVIEEFYFALDHRPAWAGVALAVPAAAAEAVASAEAIAAAKTVAASEAVTAAEAVSTAETVATAKAVSAAETITPAEAVAASTTGSPRGRRLRSRGVDAMDYHHL